MKLIRTILFFYFLTAAFILNAQGPPYAGGNYGGSSSVGMQGSACTFTVPETLKIYWGGSYGGSNNNVLNGSTCTFTIPEEFLIYRGGSYGGFNNNVLNGSTCTFTIPEEFLIYRGGSYSGSNNNVLNGSTCPAPELINIYSGGIASSAASGNLITNTTNNTTGPYLKTINDTAIILGNCINLTTTGTGATTFNWQPSLSLDNASLQSPKATPTVTTTYTLTAGENIGCREKIKVRVEVIDLGITTINYPTQISNTITTPQEVILTGITSGTFSASSVNLKINPDNGLIYPNTSTIGTYTVYYTYGTCNNTISTTVEITNGINVGTIEYPSIFKGGFTASSTPKSDLVQETCALNYDYTQMIYSGGFTASSTPVSNLSQLTCLMPVGDNFYLGGSGTGYANGNLTPSLNPVTGTAVKASSDVTICPGNPVTLTATGAIDYLWTLSNGTIASTGSSLTVTPAVTTTYIVKGTDASVGCINTAKVTVTVILDPFTSLSYGGYIFDEEDLNLKKINYINGPLNGTFSYTPSGLSFNNSDGSFTPGLSTSGIYAINYAYTKGICNYNYTANINITKLPPTINYINPLKFFINYDGVAFTPINTGGEAKIFEAMDPLPTGLNFNTLTGVISGTPTALVDNLPIRVRAANYKRDASINWSEITTISISVKKPTITLVSNTIPSLNTTYGSPSTTTTITVQAENIIDHVLVVAPSGFETSVLANSGFSDSTKMYPTADRLISQPLYIRLKRTTNVGNHNGNFTFSSTSADGLTVSATTSYVAPAALAITGKYFQKFYGSRINIGVGSKYFTATGLMNNETVGSVTLAASGGTAIDDAVGYYSITPSAATGGTFSSSNYNITYNVGQFQVVYSLYNFNMSGTHSNWVKGTVPIPKITNLIVSNITKSSATIEGKIPSSYVNIEEYGICYGTSINPKITDQKIANGSSIPGSFSFELTGLSVSTKYFVRAYITVGNTTFYSPNMRFKTLNPSIGEAYLGGKLAYILKVGDPGYDPEVVHGIIAAETDNPVKDWGCVGTLIAGANGTAIGTGLQNTNDIINLCTSTTNAANYSAALTSNGYSDWFLPSKDEMLLLYNARTQIGGFVNNGWYLTSSQFSNNFAWILDFATNPTQGRLHGDWKDWTLSSRAIRYF
ncbi:MAG: putative Ig domain-containing protein [Sediminibacterium sp.]